MLKQKRDLMTKVAEAEVNRDDCQSENRSLQAQIKNFDSKHSDLIQRVQSQQIEIYKLETEIHKIEDIRRQYEALQEKYQKLFIHVKSTPVVQRPLQAQQVLERQESKISLNSS